MPRILRAVSVQDRSVQLPTRAGRGSAPSSESAAAEDVVTDAPQMGTGEPAPTETSREDLETLRRQVYDEAYEEGYRAGLTRAATEADAAVSRLAEIADALAATKSESLYSIEDEVVELTYEATARFVGKAMVDKEAVLAVVRQVLARASERKDRLILRVAPQDYDVVKAHESELAGLVNAQRIDIEPDIRVELGGCLLEAPRGNLDGRLEMQFQKFREALLEARALSDQDGTPV